jgi:hypothetical protein
MTATDLLAELRAQGVLLSVDGDRLVYDAPTGTMTPALLAMLRETKAGLVALLQVPAAGPPESELVARPSASATVAQGQEWGRLDERGRLAWHDGAVYAPTITGGWIMVKHPTRRMIVPGTFAVDEPRGGAMAVRPARSEPTVRSNLDQKSP